MAHEESDFISEEADWEMANAEVMGREFRTVNRQRIRDLPLRRLPQEGAERLNEVVHEHPYPFMIGAAVLGLALGALLGSLIENEEEET